MWSKEKGLVQITLSDVEVSDKLTLRAQENLSDSLFRRNPLGFSASKSPKIYQGLFDLMARLVDEPVPHFEEIGGQDDCFFQLRSIAMEYLGRLRDTTIGPFKERLKNPLYK